ncbi:hypothetical protein E1B28_010945 [Marasmius oreades]|uniref:Uncharacterized protein n=1 Tax=Marasmius oreades TaxID=181124 RepID=A0A9P7RT13_9AGAR|nr:uncharacterized protein E1B28_010945 [Marasmius oreades]KAG7089246.1 hypothetical protein E1B28_010945 [Marasmius oreades]
MPVGHSKRESSSDLNERVHKRLRLNCQLPESPVEMSGCRLKTPEPKSRTPSKGPLTMYRTIQQKHGSHAALFYYRRLPSPTHTQYPQLHCAYGRSSAAILLSPSDGLSQHNSKPNVWKWWEERLPRSPAESPSGCRARLLCKPNSGSTTSLAGQQPFHGSFVQGLKLELKQEREHVDKLQSRVEELESHVDEMGCRLEDLESRWDDIDWRLEDLGSRWDEM